MSKEKIQQLLKAVGSMPQGYDTAIECAEINWQEPHYFDKEQLAKLDAFTQKGAAVLSESFTVSCRSQFEVEIAGTSQIYAREFSDTANEGDKKDYYLSFGSDPGKEFGLLVIPEQTAVFWAKQLLGDSDSNENSERELSQLEETLLYDLASALVKALANAHAKCQYSPSGNIVRGQLPIKLKDSEEMFRISFSVKKAGSDNNSNVSFIIPCVRLEAVAGKNKYSPDESSSQDFSKIILEHIDLTPVCITARLASGELSVEEMMNLQCGDIIVLDKQIEEPVELIIEGRTVAFGLPGKSEGQYAVTIEATDFFSNE
jgi:flagellar motor switch protein FliM